MNHGSPVPAVSSVPPRPCASFRRRRSSKEILDVSPTSSSSSSNTLKASNEKSSGDSPLQLGRKSLNVSAGGVFYERAKSRRGRHRKALMENENILSAAVALGRGGSMGPHRASSFIMIRHSVDDKEQSVEDKYKQKGYLPKMRLREQLLPPPIRRNQSRAPSRKRAAMKRADKLLKSPLTKLPIRSKR